MKKAIIIVLSFTISIFNLEAQNVGIGTPAPNQLLHVKDGNLYVENGEVRLDPFGSKIYRSGANVVVGAQANLRLNPGTVYDVTIQSGGITYANFEGNSKRFGLGIGSSLPSESFHSSGAILIGEAVADNNGTIQWDGNDFLGATNEGWKSLLIPSEMMDADADTYVKLVEDGQDSINFRIDDKKYANFLTWADGSHYVDWHGDPSSGAFEKIQHRFFIDDKLAGLVGATSGSLNTVEMVGDDRAVLRAAYNDGGNQTTLTVGKVFSSYGVGIASGTPLSGSLRAMLDVRGDLECDGAEVNNGLTVNDGATINDVMTLTPMPEPASGSAGDVYMDDGSCSSCGGDVRLRFHNGTSWKTL